MCKAFLHVYLYFSLFSTAQTLWKLAMNLFLKNVKEMKHVSLIHNSTE